MKRIQLDDITLKDLCNQMIYLDNVLLTERMPSAIKIMGEIKNNVRSENPNRIIAKIENQLSSLQKAMKSDFSKLETFLKNQISAYQKTEEESKAAVMNAINRMNQVGENASASSTQPEAKQTGFGAYLKTLGASVASSFLDLGEGVVDAHIYAVGEVLSWFGVDDNWSENAVSYEVIDYDAWVSDVSPEIAYGWANSVGSGVGKFAGYSALSKVPYAGTALCATAGAGSYAENSMNTQLAETGEINDLKVFGSSLIGSAEGYSAAKLSNVFKKPVDKIQTASAGNAGKGVVNYFTKNGATPIKDMGKVMTGTGKQLLTDSRTYVNSGAQITQYGLSKIGGYDEPFSIGKAIGDTAPNIGASGLEVVAEGIARLAK